MNISKSLSWVFNSTQLSHLELILLNNLLYPIKYQLYYNTKLNQLRRFWTSIKVHILLGMEGGLKFPMVKKCSIITELLHTNDPTREVVGYNRWDNTSTESQWGWTRAVDFDTLGSLMGLKGLETAGLWRYVWITNNRGKKGKLRIIVAYRPHKNTTTNTSKPMYQQKIFM